MSNLLARLLLSLILISATPALYIFTYFMTYIAIGSDDSDALVTADVVGALFLSSCWLLIWRRQVAWTPKRRLLTLLAAFWSFIPTLVVAVLVLMVRSWEDELAAILGGLTWAVSWLASTVFIWRETAFERARRLGQISESAIACPRCGYNMTGLNHARCPECGTQYTLNELFATLRDPSIDLETDRVVSI